MFSAGILILLAVFLYIRLNNILEIGPQRLKNNYADAKHKLDNLQQRNTGLKKETSDLKNTLEKTIALYDTTKEICKSLEEEKVFGLFKEEVNKYIGIRDCRFTKGNVSPLEYGAPAGLKPKGSYGAESRLQTILSGRRDKNYIVLPLDIDKNRIGYLIADGIKQEDREIFYVLAQQFLLGIKRAFLYQKIQELAITDSLTGVFSRRYYLDRLKEEIGRSKKFNLNFSFLMIDVDHFKDYNDRYGHLVGDAILKEISQTIKENIRQIDLLGRYGGEEFSIILTETDKEGARFAAERIRQSIEEKNFRVYDEDLKMTISLGISVFPADSQESGALIDKADQALYKAKETGRNRVCACN